MKFKSLLSKKYIFGILPFVFIIIMIIYFNSAPMIEFGVQLPDIAIETVDFLDTEILITVRNTGHIPIKIAIADINDRIQPAAIEPDNHLERFEVALVRIPFAWNESEPYKIGLTTADGIRFEKEIKSSFHSLSPNFDTILLFITIGICVGIIPIFIGVLWLPFIKLIKSKYSFFLSFTIGLLLFLAIDTIEELFHISENLSSFNSTLLIITIILLSVICLHHFSNKLSSGITYSKPVLLKYTYVALVIAIGIGLHNFGEGISIGASIRLGQMSLGNFLIMGFALHNITEGVAIATPLSKEKSIKNIIVVAIIAGFPTILGVLIGGFVYSIIASVIFLSIGVGSIIYIILTLLNLIKKEHGNITSVSNTSGISFAMITMYATSILI